MELLARPVDAGGALLTLSRSNPVQTMHAGRGGCRQLQQSRVAVCVQPGASRRKTAEREPLPNTPNARMRQRGSYSEESLPLLCRW